jgi:RNA polymerase sigma-70 factor, ECF subfamily
VFGRDALVTEIPRLRRYAQALAGDSSRADDLVQDTLERALNKWLLWRRGSDLRAWLFAIMHNLFVNQVRTPPLVEFRADDAMPETQTRATQTDGLALRDLERALAELTADQREVLLLIGLEELSYAEASCVLGVPLGTVMSRLSRARVRLGALLDGQAGGASLKVVK